MNNYRNISVIKKILQSDTFIRLGQWFSRGTEPHQLHMRIHQTLR